MVKILVEKPHIMKKSSRSLQSALSNPKMRSLTSTKPQRGISSRNLDTTEYSDISEYEIQEGNDPGVRYITQTLIQRLSKQENLAFVSSLNLSLSKDGGKKFKFIENLEKCEQLEVLNLSHNLIEKIEKLERQTRLRELNLAHNRIRKIEGVEHMQNLQKLNLSINEIEHIPAWMGKKMKALRTLNMKQNIISSLQDVSRLKPLKDLTSLVLADNPVANLPHYRPYVIFHLRSLNSLDGQMITIQERQEAHDRFNLEEVEKLERDLEKRMKEIEELQSQKMKVVSELHNQDQLNTSLRQEAQQQKKSYQEMEREMTTKNEILTQKTLALSRACQKQYQLEQELAFYKIDAKFEPLGYLTSEEVDAEDAPEESPYIGKARYKRNLYAQEEYIPHRAQQIQVGKVEIDADDQIKNQQIRARIHTTLDVDLNEKEKTIRAAEAKLFNVRQEIVHAEEQILRASEELKELEEAVAQKKISEAEKEELRQQLRSRIQILNQLRDEAQELERQMERQRGEMDKKLREIEGLQRHLDSLSPQDPRHSHVKAQKVNKEQQLEMMDRQYKQLEGRLDDMLSRIARETEEIKDLEQQLTEGQIAANEALKRDLEGIISGLQEYLESVKGQAKQAHDECRALQSEREVLLQRLEELEAAAQEADHMRKEVEDLEQALQEQQEVNEALQQAQGDLHSYEGQLETQIRARDAEITQLKQELEQRKRQQHADNSAWKAELESARTEAHQLQEQEKDHKKLMSQVQQLQDENGLLVSQVEGLQAQLRAAEHNLVHPEQISARVSELKRKLQTGVGELRCSGPSDVLGQNLVELQRQIGQILQKSEKEKREVQERHRKLQEEVAALQERARQAPEDYKRACNKAVDAKLELEKRQHEAALRQLENQVRQLNEKLSTMEEIQGLADQQLLEAEEERERLLAELRDLEAERRMEGSRAQQELSGLDHEMKELKRAVATSDKMTASELTNTKEQLRTLHGTVFQINRERAEEMQEAENYNFQAARAARDLAKAETEIELLQELLHNKEKQLQDADPGLADSQRLHIHRLNDAVQKQQAELDRLRHLLEHAREDNIWEMENLLDEIQSLRCALLCQSNDLTSMGDPIHRKGYWYYLPASCNNSGRDSLSTKDSGVSLHHPMTSSATKRRSYNQRHGQEAALAAGHWVYSPLRPAGNHCHSDKDAEADSDDVPPSCHFIAPLGSVIYTIFPDGTPVPPGTVIYGPPPPSEGRPLAPGTVIYGPPPIGSQLVYGPPPPQFTIPVDPAGVLHCNVSVHHDLENELSRLEDIIDHLKFRLQKEKCLKSTLKDDLKVLESQREALRREVEELQNSAKKRKRKNFVDGHVESLMLELELECSLEHHNDIEDEIDCVEKTLRKRRVELREAVRLLAEAESDLKDTREKTMDVLEKHNVTKKHLGEAESDAEELERRAQETAVSLVKADQQLRMLQTNARDLEQHRTTQEAVLQGINSIVAAKDAEFQSLNSKMEVMTESLQKLQKEIRAAEGKEEENDQMLREAENLVVEKRSILEQLHCQISAQQEEAAQLDRILGHKKQELHLLQSHIHQKKVDLKVVLRDGELEVAERRREIAEVKSFLEELSVQKGDLSAQLNEKKSQLSALRQEILEEGDHLQETISEIHRQKSELKLVLEMQQLENNELQGLRLQHEQKISDLEKTQVLLLQGKLELENLQRTLQRVHGEVERQRQLLEKDHQEIELLMAQMHTLQEKMDVLNTQKENLEKSNQELERRLGQSKKALSDMEESDRTASAALERLEAEIRSQQDELSHLSKRKQISKQETANAEQVLEDTTAELNCLTAELADVKEQLRLLEQDVISTTKHRDNMLQEKSALQEDVTAAAGRHRLLQEKERTTDERLRQLHRSVEEKDMHLKQILTEIEGRDGELREAAARLENDRQNYKREVSDQQNALDMMAQRISAQEERALKLQQEERWGAALEESLHAARRLLSEQEEKLQDKCNEAAALQKELETYRSDLSRIQDEATSARRRDEKRILTLKETITKQQEERAEELRRENSGLKKQLTLVEQAAYDNHERAKRLLKEMALLQAEHSVLQRQLKSQEELDKRQQEVNEAVKELKAQVKLEIQSSLQEIQCTAADELLEDVEPEPELEHSLRAQLDRLKEEYPFSTSKSSQENRGTILDEQWRGEASREKLLQQEDRLKAQLHQRLSKQADVLSRGRQQTEGSLHSLRRQLTALDNLVCYGAADSLFHSHNSSGLRQSLTQGPSLQDYTPDTLGSP
ncbi:centriolin isoform X2 [Phyllobates terribilis]|uniref:centriolin isoform X2 n=1 Tax=Phyllobates terribilis TaxID=111132 RepID=UPI003CCAF697